MAYVRFSLAINIGVTIRICYIGLKKCDRIEFKEVQGLYTKQPVPTEREPADRGESMITNSEWVGINELSLLIHGTKSVADMQRYFLEALRNIVPFERAVFYLFQEEAGGQLTLQSPVFIRMDPAVVQVYGKLINSNGICRRVISLRRTMAYRSSDLITPDDKATDAVAEVKKSFLLPNDIQFYSGIVLTEERTLLGEVVLYRTARQRDFTDNEIEILDKLKDHLAIRLRQQRHLAAVPAEKRCDAEESLLAMGLTPRESEIAALVMQQCSTEDISRRLVISQYTTKKHLHHIFSKLGVRNRLQLIEAIREYQKP